MTPDWHALCKDPRLEVTDDGISVSLVDGRTHHVRVEATHDAWELIAVVATPRVLASVDAPSLQCWTRNRFSDLVAFRIDWRGRLLAHGWVPRAGVTASEFTMQVGLLAREADRFEFSLSGADEH